MEHLDNDTFLFCRNILAIKKPGHIWLQLTDEEILLNTHLAKKDSTTGELKLKYASLILFGKEDAIEEFIPRYRFEAMFHMCTYKQYNDMKQFPNRYDDRRTMRCNLIKLYDLLTQFTERYLPNKFYLPPGTTQREDLRWNLFREIVANLCVHSDFSSGYACFFHVFSSFFPSPIWTCHKKCHKKRTIMSQESSICPKKKQILPDKCPKKTPWSLKTKS